MTKQKFAIQGEEIFVENHPSVFPPSPHGIKGLGGNIEVHPGESVVDIGSGTGILGIFAAKKGGNVLAVDILDEALDCTRANALLNNVSIKVKKSNLFSNVPKRKYDIIIANVPQEVLSPKIKKGFTKEIVIGMHGKEGGSKLLKCVLVEAKGYMKPSSRLYVVVFTMTDWRSSLKLVRQNYEAKLLEFYSGNVKDFVYKDLDWYLSKPSISIYKRDKEYWADLFVFELRLKR